MLDAAPDTATKPMTPATLLPGGWYNLPGVNRVIHLREDGVLLSAAITSDWDLADVREFDGDMNWLRRDVLWGEMANVHGWHDAVDAFEVPSALHGRNHQPS